jgi:hypothetical protein
MSGALEPPKNNGRRWPGPDRRQIEKNNSTPKPSYEPHRAGRRKPRLRSDYRFMEPDELAPEERWDRIVELLAIMAMPDAPTPVLNSENGTSL